MLKNPLILNPQEADDSERQKNIFIRINCVISIQELKNAKIFQE